MKLTREQIEAVSQGKAVEVTVGQTPCVVLNRDVYARLQHLLSDEWTPEEMARLAWEAGKSIGWDDPRMDAYDDYEKHKP